MVVLLCRLVLSKPLFCNSICFRNQEQFCKTSPKFIKNCSLETCMQVFDSIRKFRNRKRCNTARTMTKREKNSPEGSSAVISQETNENEGPKVHSLTQEEDNERIVSFIAALTRQLEDLNRLLQGLKVASHFIHYLKPNTEASCNAHSYLPDSCQNWKSKCVLFSVLGKFATHGENKEKFDWTLILFETSPFRLTI